jgi:hypothetical protein
VIERTREFSFPAAELEPASLESLQLQFFMSFMLFMSFQFRLSETVPLSEFREIPPSTP